MAFERFAARENGKPRDREDRSGCPDASTRWEKVLEKSFSMARIASLEGEREEPGPRQEQGAAQTGSDHPPRVDAA